MSAQHQLLNGDAARMRRETRLMIQFVVAMLILGSSCWWIIPKITPACKGWLGRRYVPEIIQHTREHDWPSAVVAMKSALRWAPDDPAVLHAAMELIVTAGGEPRTVISFVRRLQQRGYATSEDIAQMGRMYIRLSETAKANEVFETIRPEDRHQPNALMLQSDLLAADGRKKEAVEARRAALLLMNDQPEALIELAQMDLASGDPAQRRYICERLWQAARGHAQALSAIEVLATVKDLTLPQAAELLELVNASTGDPVRQNKARLTVLSAHMRLSPQMRSDIVQAEVIRWGGQPAKFAPLAVWLVAERETARLLRLVPAKVAMRYTDLLPPYVAALRIEKKWRELDDLLQPGKIDDAFSPQQIRLWRAENLSHLDTDLSRARQMLSLVFEEAGRGEKLAETLQVAALAEQLNLWDTAQICFQAVAVKHPQTREAMLPKIYEMAENQRDGRGMLQVCDSLLEWRPDSVSYLLQKLYLQMLLGIEIEMAAQTLQTVANSNSERYGNQIWLLNAMAAYRQSRPDQMAAALSQVAAPEELPPGLRSVYAALYKQTAQADMGRAFRLVERVHPALLLPEEKIFLKRAL